MRPKTSVISTLLGANRKLPEKLIYVSLCFGLSLFWVFILVVLVKNNANFYQVSTSASNAAIVPALFYACYLFVLKRQLGCVLEILGCLAVMTSSSIYHLEDQNTIPRKTFCYETLQHADFTASYLLITLVPLSMARQYEVCSEWMRPMKGKTCCGSRNWLQMTLRFVVLCIAFPIIHIAMKKETRFKPIGVLYSAIAVAIAVLFFLVMLYVRIMSIQYNQYKRYKNSTLLHSKCTILHNLLKMIPKDFLVADIVLKTSSLIFNFVLANDRNYEIVHSYGWHVPAFLSMYLTFKWTYVWNVRIFKYKEMLNASCQENGESIKTLKEKNSDINLTSNGSKKLENEKSSRTTFSSDNLIDKIIDGSKSSNGSSASDEALLKRNLIGQKFLSSKSKAVGKKDPDVWMVNV